MNTSSEYKPYVVLCTFEPDVWKSWVIGRTLTGMTKMYGLAPHKDPNHGAQEWVPWYDTKLHAEVRIWTVNNPKGADWHQDGDLTPGASMNCGLVLWADTKPTELRVNGTIYQPKPYELVLFRNLVGHHRRPPECKGGSQRWVFRQRVSLPCPITLP